LHHPASDNRRPHPGHAVRTGQQMAITIRHHGFTPEHRLPQAKVRGELCPAGQARAGPAPPLLARAYRELGPLVPIDLPKEVRFDVPEPLPLDGSSHRLWGPFTEGKKRRAGVAGC
jgi:hypothetical protein